jgi:hypothetical protein
MKFSSARNIVARFVCWILLLQMINISIDPADLKQFKSAQMLDNEDLSINEMESVYELVSENVFEKDVPESDESDVDKQSHTFDLYCSKFGYTPQPVFAFVAEYYQYYQRDVSFDCPQPTSPPPRRL